MKYEAVNGKAIGTEHLSDGVYSDSLRSRDEDLRKLSEDFESLFLDIVLKSMRKSVQKSGFIDGGNAEEMYRSMLDSEYAKIMAEDRMTGMSEIIFKQLGDLNPPKRYVANQYGKTGDR